MHTWRKQFGNVCAINLFTRRIEDEEQFAILASIGKPRDHQIVDDAATIIQISTNDEIINAIAKFAKLLT